MLKELDRALLDGKSNLSVHSLKDMPMEVLEELPLLAFSKRDVEQMYWCFLKEWWSWTRINLWMFQLKENSSVKEAVS